MFVSLIDNLSLFTLLVFVLVLVSVVLSTLSLILVRRAIAATKTTPTEASAVPGGEVSPKKVAAMPRVEGKAVRPPPAERRAKGEVEIKPTEPEEWIGFTSIGELASVIGAKSLILFNQSGITIDSHNVEDEDRVSASLADFIAIMRKLNPDFDSMVSGDGLRAVLVSVGTIGETEVFAFAASDKGMALELEEVRGFIRAYLSESLGRYR